MIQWAGSLLALSKDELLALIGVDELSPGQADGVSTPAQVAALVAMYPGEDLVALGHRRVARVLEAMRDPVRDTVCPLWQRGEEGVQLVMAILGVIAGAAGVLPGIAVVIAAFLVDGGLDDLCEGWAPSRPVELSA